MQHQILYIAATVAAVMVAGAAICLSVKRKIITFTISPQARQTMRLLLLRLLPPGEVCGHLSTCCSTPVYESNNVHDALSISLATPVRHKELLVKSRSASLHPPAMVVAGEQSRQPIWQDVDPTEFFDISCRA